MGIGYQERRVTDEMKSSEGKISIGTLGSAATFAGEATERMRKAYPEFGEPVYFPSMDACWLGLKNGVVDVVILGTERTGQPHHGDAVITHGFWVIGESSQPLKCSLYVKPGSAKTSIRKISGHGSIYQCAVWLDREFPGIPREAHGLNSVEAAKAMIAGDGTMAVVGSESLPKMVAGLEEIASDIDDGAISNWWAVSNKQRFSDEPDSLVITSRCGPDGQLGELIVAIARIGYTLQTAAAFPVNSGVKVYHYMLAFSGKGVRKDVENVIGHFSGTRLAGAFDKRG
jgi:prephenate dehydratase